MAFPLARLHMAHTIQSVEDVSHNTNEKIKPKVKVKGTSTDMINWHSIEHWNSLSNPSLYCWQGWWRCWQLKWLLTLPACQNKNAIKIFHYIERYLIPPPVLVLSDKREILISAFILGSSYPKHQASTHVTNWYWINGSRTEIFTLIWRTKSMKLLDMHWIAVKPANNEYEWCLKKHVFSWQLSTG